MSHPRRGHAEIGRPRPSHPSPTGSGDVVLVTLTPEESARLGLTADQPLQVDRTRKPANGDLVWIEIVRHGSTQRLVRTYQQHDGWVTLTAADGETPAVMRRQGEVLLLGVVVGPATGPAASS